MNIDYKMYDFCAKDGTNRQFLARMAPASITEKIHG